MGEPCSGTGGEREHSGAHGPQDAAPFGFDGVGIHEGAKPDLVRYLDFACLRRSTSRTLRIDNLSAAIASPCL